MSAPEPVDGDLAWAIATWNGFEMPDTPLGRDRTESLARHLTKEGFSKGKTGGFSGLLSQLEDVGTRVVDEFGPLIDSLRKPK